MRIERHIVNMKSLPNEKPNDVFFPKYPAKSQWGVFIIGIFGAYSIYNLYHVLFSPATRTNNPDWAMIVFNIFFVFWLANFMYLNFNKVIRVYFFDECLVFHKPFGRISTYGYSEVVDLHERGVKIGKDFISFSAIDNAEELYDIIKSLIKKKKVCKEDFSGEIEDETTISRKVILLSMPAALILTYMSFFILKEGAKSRFIFPSI